jgi:hypothetical protein
MPNMHRRHLPGNAVGLKGKLGNRHPPPEHQAVIDLPGQPGMVQKKLDAWTAGAAEYEAYRCKWRKKHHRFIPMGTRDECDRCGAPRNELITIERRGAPVKVPLHREPTTAGKRGPR